MRTRSYFSKGISNITILTGEEHDLYGCKKDKEKKYSIFFVFNLILNIKTKDKNKLN
jgi:hypothetical protein